MPPLHVGIRYNYFNKYVDMEHTFDSGRYFIGPWNTFVKFPSALQSIEFSNEERLGDLGVRYPPLHTRTKEGLALHMQVALQYQLRRDEVGKLYREFNQDYEQMFVSTIRDTLIKAAADYEAQQLWKIRHEVGVKMHSMVNEALRETYAECWGLQLMVIELPQMFDQAIVQTQVQKQNFSTMQYAQQATQIRAETGVIAAEYDRRVKVIMAYGQANYSLNVKTAKASARKQTLEVEAGVLDGIKGELQLGADDLVEYQELSAIQMLRNASVLFGFEESGAQVLMPMGDAAREDAAVDRAVRPETKTEKVKGEL